MKKMLRGGVPKYSGIYLPAGGTNSLLGLRLCCSIITRNFATDSISRAAQIGSYTATLRTYSRTISRVSTTHNSKEQYRSVSRRSSGEL